MIFIRADANKHIGTGHIMRCMSIAYAFAEIGKEIVFITADHRGDALISGFPSICLDSIWNEMDSEICKLEGLIKEKKPELLLIDSYYVTEKYLKTASSMVQTAYMDDLNETCWDVDYLINYNVFADILDYSWYKETRTNLFLNPQYAPLRDEFKNLPSYKIELVKDILVSAGGADPEKITERIIEGICPTYPDIIFHFIVGALNPRLDAIRTLIPKNAVLHVNEYHMASLMQKCDAAISAAGTTLYELCAVGVPTITYTLADNQLIAAEKFCKQGFMLSAGECRGDVGFIDRLDSLLKCLISNHEMRRRLSAKMQALVDGNGASRIAEDIIL